MIPWGWRRGTYPIMHLQLPRRMTLIALDLSMQGKYIRGKSNSPQISEVLGSGFITFRQITHTICLKLFSKKIQ